MRASEFANYKLLDAIEDAPLGDMYKAYNYDTKDVVALLLLPEELRDLDEHDLESILKDLRTAAAAKPAHPGMVHVTHVGCRQGRHYIEMEFVKGESLRRHVEKKGPLSPDAASRILRSVAEALNVAHDKRVVHRAVSPSDIILLEDEEAKLGHFGMARLVIGLRKLLGRKADNLISKDTIPEEAYLSPEQKEGFGGDERSDIYGLGATLVFMLRGQRPGDLAQLPAPGADHPLYDLARRMTNPDRKKRIQTCETVLMALDHLDEESSAEMPSPTAPSSRKGEQKLPAEVGGDPSDTLLWDTRQLDALRSQREEKRASPSEGREPPPPGQEERERPGVAPGYEPAFQPLIVDDSSPRKSMEERGRELALARKRANVQLVFGIALNLVLFLIVLKLALPLIERYRSGSVSAPEEKAGPREYGAPSERPTLTSPRPSPIPREAETTTGPPSSEEKAAPKPETPVEPPKAGPAPEKPSAGATPTEREAAPPAEPAPSAPKAGPKKKPAAGESGGASKEAKEQPAQKDPMKSDFMKDEPRSYYDDPNWAKKGKTTVRIIIPEWHKKKDDASEEKPEDSQKPKPEASKKTSDSEPAPAQPAAEK